MYEAIFNTIAQFSEEVHVISVASGIPKRHYRTGKAPCIIKQHACHKGIWERRVMLHAFLTSAINTGGRVHNQAAAESQWYQVNRKLSGSHNETGCFSFLHNLDQHTL
jgi:hypothetical protein